MAAFRDKIKRLGEEAVSCASSPETRARLQAAGSKAKELVESEAGQKAIALGRDLSVEVLEHLADGDAPTQAAAKTIRHRVVPSPSKVDTDEVAHP